jgi:hypothetical protein
MDNMRKIKKRICHMVCVATMEASPADTDNGHFHGSHRLLSQLCQAPLPAAGQPAEARLAINLPKPLFRVYGLRATAAAVTCEPGARTAWQTHLMGDSGTTCRPFAMATGLGCAGFFLPLLKPMLGIASTTWTGRRACAAFCPALRRGRRSRRFQAWNDAGDSPSFMQNPTMLRPLAR